MSTSKLCNVEVRHDYHQNCLQVKTISPDKDAKDGEKDKSKKMAMGSKETLRYFTNDGLKVMIVPSKDKNYNPIPIRPEELARLQEKAVVVTDREKLQKINEAMAEQLRLEMECEERKNEFKKYDEVGKTGKPGRLSWLEREARDKANYLLKRAWELKNEEEDAVKKVNSLILQAKCQAIRDAQLAEHQLLQREMKKEEKRLEQMMEDQRIKLITDEKKKREEERLKKANYIKALNNQLEEINAHKLLAAEMQIEERRRANEAMFVVMLEDLEESRRKEEEKRKTREALNQANDQIRRAQEIEREEERITDLKLLEYMRMKAEREEQFERDRENKGRELECARVGKLQEKAVDSQIIQDTMNAVRRQEQYEREWRKKEMEEVKKRLKMEEDCRLAREQQIRDIRRFQAMEIARDKREFERDLQVQMERQEKERLLELKKRHKAEVYREEILKQINQKEKERIEERQQKFQEGIALKAEDAKKKQELKEALRKKIDNLRQNNVPDMYINDILRQFDL